MKSLLLAALFLATIPAFADDGEAPAPTTPHEARQEARHDRRHGRQEARKDRRAGRQEARHDRRDARKKWKKGSK